MGFLNTINKMTAYVSELPSAFCLTYKHNLFVRNLLVLSAVYRYVLQHRRPFGEKDTGNNRAAAESYSARYPEHIRTNFNYLIAL